MLESGQAPRQVYGIQRPFQEMIFVYISIISQSLMQNKLKGDEHEREHAEMSGNIPGVWRR